MLIEFLLGSVLLLSGMLCIIGGLWADPKTLCVPIGYGAGSHFRAARVGAFLQCGAFMRAVHMLGGNRPSMTTAPIDKGRRAMSANGTKQTNDQA